MRSPDRSRRLLVVMRRPRGLGGGAGRGGWLLMCGWRSCEVAGPISPAPSPRNADGTAMQSRSLAINRRAALVEVC